MFGYNYFNAYVSLYLTVTLRIGWRFKNRTAQIALRGYLKTPHSYNLSAWKPHHSYIPSTKAIYPFTYYSVIGDTFTLRSKIGAVVVVIVWQLDLELPLPSVPITTNVVSSNPTQARCTRYNIVWWSLSVTCNRSVPGFLRALRFPPPIKLIATIWLNYCWKWRFKHHKPNL